MFSSLFGSGKKKHSPEESDEIPPIMGPEDGFTVVSIAKDSVSEAIYPHFGQDGSVKYPSQPTLPPVPQRQKPIHYLQGVPFALSKELSASTNKDTIAVQISSIMAYITRGLHIDSLDYDFSIEKGVALEG